MSVVLTCNHVIIQCTVQYKKKSDEIVCSSFKLVSMYCTTHVGKTIYIIKDQLSAITHSDSIDSWQAQSQGMTD